MQWILDLTDVRPMADILPTARSQDPPPQPVDRKWVSRFVNSQSELQKKKSTRWSTKACTFQGDSLKLRASLLLGRFIGLVQHLRSEP